MQPVSGKGWGNETGACCARNAHGVSGTQKKEQHVEYFKWRHRENSGVIGEAVAVERKFFKSEIKEMGREDN